MNGHPITDICSIFLIDQDQILAQLHRKVRDRFNEQLGHEAISLNSFTNNSPAKGLAHIPGAKDLVEKWLAEPGFYRDLLPVEGAVAGMEALVKGGYRPIILSSFGNAPQCVPDKDAWLNEHFPFLRRRDRIFSPCKELVAAYNYLDDGLSYLRAWQEAAWNLKGIGGTRHSHTFRLPYTNLEEAANFEIDTYEGWTDLIEELQDTFD